MKVEWYRQTHTHMQCERGREREKERKDERVRVWKKRTCQKWSRSNNSPFWFAFHWWWDFIDIHLKPPIHRQMFVGCKANSFPFSHLFFFLFFTATILVVFCYWRWCCCHEWFVFCQKQQIYRQVLWKEVNMKRCSDRRNNTATNMEKPKCLQTQALHGRFPMS